MNDNVTRTTNDNAIQTTWIVDEWRHEKRTTVGQTKDGQCGGGRSNQGARTTTMASRGRRDEDREGYVHAI